MQLNSTFIKGLVIPFNEVLPPGTLKEIRSQLNVSEHTPRKVLTGQWTNEPLAISALNAVKRHHELIGRFLKQFPKEILEQAQKA
ncbi:MAG TPA: hypothetical protein ENJ95_03485 [Bacteroidetes bacterium]|nr:hypothetical protein [Bacteroidota bacterium]